MNKTHIKIFLKEESNVIACLKLMQILKTNNIVEAIKICSEGLNEPQTKLEKLSPVQERLRRKYQETERMLALLQNMSANDLA